MNRLDAAVVNVADLVAADRASMFGLYQSYYDGAEISVFNRDLESKDYVVLLTDSAGSVGGFSTLAVFDDRFENSEIKVLYSGDTIIDKAYWGKNEFAMAWLQLAGRIKQHSPQTPLYWLLIVKGHRTYRYLSLFSKNYYPRYDVDTPAEQQRIMDYLARQRFGDNYDPDTGLVRLPEPRSYLNEELAPIPQKDSWRPDIRYFLARNPGYARGDELLCLCELETGNLKRFAREWFLAGMRA